MILITDTIRPTGAVLTGTAAPVFVRVAGMTVPAYRVRDQFDPRGGML